MQAQARQTKGTSRWYGKRVERACKQPAQSGGEEGRVIKKGSSCSSRSNKRF